MYFETRRHVLYRERIMELDQRAGRHPDYAHYSVCQSALAHPVRSRNRSYFRRVVIEHESDGVGIMYGYVENNTAACARAAASSR